MPIIRFGMYKRLLAEDLATVQAMTEQDAKRMNKQSWLIEEHNRFLEALSIYGRNDAYAVSDFIRTRTRAQVHSHAQKYFYKIDQIVHKGVEEAAQYARQSFKQVNWNLLQNGIINEPNYEWCKQAYAGTTLILGVAFANSMTQLSWYIVRGALKYIHSQRPSDVSDQFFKLYFAELDAINICVCANPQVGQIVDSSSRGHYLNLTSLIYAQDQILCVMLAKNGVQKFLEKIFRILIIYQEFVKNTQDYPSFIIKNLAAFEKLDEDAVNCILLCVTIQSALIRARM